jgi:hypothetical protein
MFITTESGQALTTEGGQELLVENPAPYQPLQQILPSYLYLQYSDDLNLQAFVAAQNDLAQTYLDWFNDTPLGIYTSPNIVGPLLDWILGGIYGLQRPVFSSLTTSFVAGINASAINALPINGALFSEGGTAIVATDDFYKRTATWWYYAGLGVNGQRVFNVTTLRLRIARFLYGVNGTDVTLSQAQSVHILAEGAASPPAPALSDEAAGSLAAVTYGVQLTYVTPIGETLAGPAAALTVPENYVLVVGSPPAANGVTAYNVYVCELASSPGVFRAGINANAINVSPINGTNAFPATPYQRQNADPIAIGTGWTEPTSGLVAGPGLPTANTSNTPGNFIITVPPGASSSYFQQAMENGILAFPFQLTALVIIS